MKAYHFFIPSALSPINHAILITEYLSSDLPGLAATYAFCLLFRSAFKTPNGSRSRGCMLVFFNYDINSILNTH